MNKTKKRAQKRAKANVFKGLTKMQVIREIKRINPNLRLWQIKEYVEKHYPRLK